METAFAGISGAVIGSFLNVVVYRLPLGQSLVKPRSHCPSCDTPVSPRDNVPLLSWLFLKGRCRHCGESISARYPAVELLTALCFVAVVLARGIHPELIGLIPFTAVLIAVTFIDLQYKIVPNKIMIPAAVYGLATALAFRTHALPELLIAGAGAFTFFLLAALIHPKGMGMGDVKLAGVMGLYLGRLVIPALVIAFLVGSVVGIGLVMRYGARSRKVGVPFAPFMAFGGLVAMLAGQQLIDFYLDNLG
ncbi:MAG TPA: prepilin peptidase [Thermoleophilaceae bacterium]|jgi:leader peptidase (prepilin peptidase)/N-methyltransferase|nr:prepilin peptidase [Thermoleophilaceae bacterium]